MFRDPINTERRSIARNYIRCYGLLQKIFGLRFRQNPNVTDLPMFKYQPSRIEEPTKFGLITLAPPELSTVLAFCKRNQITFTPFLDVLVMKTIDEIVRPEVSDTTVKYLQLMATSGRRYYPEMKYVTSSSAHPETYGPVATYSQQQLLDLIKTRGANVTKAMSRKVPFRVQAQNIDKGNYWDTLRSTIGVVERATGIVSNVGNHKFHSGDWKIDNMWFSQSNGALLHFVVSVASAYAGANICVGFLPEYADLKEGKLIQQFMDRLQENIRDMVETS